MLWSQQVKGNQVALAPTEPQSLVLVQENSLRANYIALATDLEAYLWQESQKYNLDYEKLHTLIQKESGWKETAVGDSGRAFGLAQFWQGTFYGYAKRYGLYELEYKDPYAQIQLMAKMIADGQAFNWTAAKGIKSFADKI